MEMDTSMLTTLILMGSLIVSISPLFLAVKVGGEVKEMAFVNISGVLGIIIILMGYLLLTEKGSGSLENVSLDRAKKPVVSPAVVTIKNTVKLDAPVIRQFPELPRGCEVTSLAMLLQYSGVEVGKMELAQLVTKNSTPLKKNNNGVFWGHPNDGYIGNMYTYNKPGFGVYHKPIKELADRFLPGRIVDLTGRDFEELKTYLSMGIPVWVITNTTYKKLPESYFETWQTPSGKVKITFKEHSVLITGYDKDNIYFNDPISGMKNKKIPKHDFKEAWQQMGSQAISYLPREVQE